MKMIIKTVCPAVLIILILIEHTFAQNLVKPVETYNTHVLYISRLFMIPESSRLQEYGTGNLGIHIIQSNTIFDRYHFLEKQKQGEIDVETTSAVFHYSVMLDEYTGIKFILPFYYHGGGFMDRIIEGFHKSFPGNGLKNGGREYGGDNEIHIRYQSAEGGPDINSSFYGPGDPSVILKRILWTGNPGITMSLGIKPGIGDKAFINSGTDDFGITISTDYSCSSFYFYAMAGYSYFFGNGIYSDELDQSRNYLFSCAAGAGVQFTQSLFFAVQFYIHNSIYSTEIDKIDYVTIINSYSLRWLLNERFIMQFCFDEDPFTYTTADIALSVKAEYSF